MKNKILIMLFVCIIVLGAVMRFYKLGDIPNSLNWDEVSWGYNAYSVGHTGKDEHGKLFPLSFQAFGDYKQPVYVYLTVLPTLLFGLTAYAVRFPSAIFGVLTIVSVFFLTREIFYKGKHGLVIAYITSLLFAISPWSVQFSRVAFEANVGIFFTITGVALFLYGIRKNKLSILISAVVVLSVSCYTYHSQKLFTPLLFLALVVLFKNYFTKYKKSLLIIIATFLLINIVWIVDMRTTARGRSVIFTSHQTEILASATEKLIYDQSHDDIFGTYFHNRRFVYTNKYIENYLSHFYPNYLFMTGDNPRHHAPGMGVLYIVSLPFIIIGAVVLWKRYRVQAHIVMVWLLLAPVASSLAVDAPNASRSMVFLPTWQILISLGILYTILYAKAYKLYVVLIIGGIFSANWFYYTHQYFFHTDTESSSYWQYGYREAIQYINKSIPKEKRIFFSSNIEQGYIFYLFYNKYDPALYHVDGGSDRLKQKCFSIENAYFGSCDDLLKSGDVEILSAEKDDSEGKNIIHTIYYPDTTKALIIAEKQ